MTKEKLVLKKFVFSSTSVEAFKAKYVESSASLELYPSHIHYNKMHFQWRILVRKIFSSQKVTI